MDVARAALLLLRVIARGIEGLQRLVLPDHWQAQGIAALKAGRDVILDTPAGAGKTFVFEKFAGATGFTRHAICTVLTRALANDKYVERGNENGPSSKGRAMGLCRVCGK